MSPRPLKVFLCHAHADRDPVRGLYTRLTQDGVDAWLDKAKLLPGQDWELEIRKAVREADVVVVCLSKQFNQAGFRQKEVRLALDTAMEKPEGEIFIIPARLEECDNLESLRKWHWVDLFEDDGYKMLMQALRARADKIGAIFVGGTRKRVKNDSTLKVTQKNVKLEVAEEIVRKKEERVTAEILPLKKVEREPFEESVYVPQKQHTANIQSEILKQLPSRKNEPNEKTLEIQAPVVAIKPLRKWNTQIIVAPSKIPTPTVLSIATDYRFPITYTMKDGEYDFCIARRFGVDPDELFAINGRVPTDLSILGIILKKPQSGKPFPCSRALNSHPTQYTVQYAFETVTSIA